VGAGSQETEAGGVKSLVPETPMRDPSSAVAPLGFSGVVHAISTPFQTEDDPATATTANPLTYSEISSSTAAPLTAYTGRYTQPDPLARILPVWQDTRFSGSLFGYASLNPLAFIDRNGLQTSAGTCCECPEGVWSYRGVSSGGSFLIGYVDFHGTYTCASKRSLEVKVDGHCWSGGLQAGFGVSFDFSPASLLLPGAKGCNVPDLFRTSTSLFASGTLFVGVTATGDPLSSTGSVGVGFGAGAGAGAQKCWTRPYKPNAPVPGQ